MGQDQAGGRLKYRWPPYTESNRDRFGNTRFYFRRAGKRVPLPGLPWSPEFMAAREKALAGAEIKPPIGSSRTIAGSLNAALAGYYETAAFQNLAPVSRRMRRGILEKLREKAGNLKLEALKPCDIAKMLLPLSPNAQRNWIKSLRPLMQHAVSIGMISADPTAAYKPTRAPKSDGFAVWSEDDARAFERRWPIGTRERLAFALLIFTGQRRGDVVTMGRQNVRNGVLYVKQSKTGTRVEIPIAAELAEVISASVPPGQMCFLESERGRPFSSQSFGNFFAAACREAGIGKAAHGLRKLMCTRLANLGCSVNEIAAISGHTTLAEVARYTRAYDRARLAKTAMAKLEAPAQPIKAQKAITARRK